MNYGKKFTNLVRQSKFHRGTYQKPPKLIELHEELFETTPGNLHNSLIDVFVFVVSTQWYMKKIYLMEKPTLN